MILGAILFLFGALVFSQTTLVTLEGIVSDEQGNALPGAVIILKEVNTGYVYSGTSREKGEYALLGIRPGDYECEVKLDGFATEVIKGMTFNVGAKLVINFTLQPAAISEELTIIAKAPMVELTKSEISSVVDRRSIEDLPLLSRSYDALSAYKVGVGSSPSYGVEANAQPRGSGEIMIDGISNEWTGTNIRRLDIPADAIQEFRVVTNQFAAEYGNASGLLQSAITRSGSNEIRGRASFFYRDEKLDAVNYFINHTEWKGDELPADQWEKPEFNHLNPSFFIGGPFKKDKAHFFLAYEGFFRESYTQIISPLMEREIVTRPSRHQRLMAKMDYQFNEKNMLSFRYGFNHRYDENYYVGGYNSKSSAANPLTVVHDIQINWTFYPSDNTMNEARITYANTSMAQTDVADPDGYHIVRPSGSFGKVANLPQHHWENKLALVENFSLFTGNHSVKIGLELSRTPLHGFISQFIPGEFQFTTDAPFNPADPSTYPFLFLYNLSPPDFDCSYSQYGLFVQDSWKVSPRLTVNYGIRYNLYDIYGLDIKKWDIRNLNPRFGFSWDPIGDEKTSIRGGVGTFSQNPVLNAGLVATLLGSWDIRAIVFPGYPDPFAPNPFMPPIPISDIGIEQYYPKSDQIAPYTVQWTLGGGRQIYTDLAVGVDFVYARGYKMMRMENINHIIPNSGYSRPDPTKGDVYEINDGGKTKYQGIYFTVKKQYSHGWMLEIAYTLSKSESDLEAEDWGLPLSGEPDFWERWWGPTDGDASHRLAITGVMDIPLGFQVSGYVYYRSALPWTAWSSGDINQDGQAYDMVDAHRNARRGCDYFTLNLRLSKFFSIDRIRLQLFAEMYNVTNRVNLGGIYERMGSSLFGEPRAADSSRQMQLGVRIDF